uniref:Transposase n=1 Tax=Ascaris lumbricoides TaxID=6252 RepID=A0A0M3I018_ASCLU
MTTTRSEQKDASRNASQPVYVDESIISTHWSIESRFLSWTDVQQCGKKLLIQECIESIALKVRYVHYGCTQSGYH